MYKIKYRKKSGLELVTPSFSERYKGLLTDDRTQIIYVKQVFDNSTFRYRAYNINQALSDSKKYNANYFLIDEISKIISDLSSLNVGAVVLQRAFWDDELQMLIDWCQVHGVVTVFDVDDYMFEPNCIPELFHAMGWSTDVRDGNMLTELAKQSALHYIAASRCDVFVATNSFLADKLKLFFDRETYVIQNFMNHEQEITSQAAVKKKSKSDGMFTIGYFSGSDSHKNDFQIISSELATLLKRHDNVNIKIVGYMSLPPDLEEFRGRIIFSPFVAYADLQYEMATVDVNIVPLFDSEFTDCKSNLKYFESAIVRTPTVASPSYAYKQSIENGVNGFLCKQGEWVNTIERLMNDSELVSDVTNNAFIDSDKYRVENQLLSIENVFDQIISRSQS